MGATEILLWIIPVLMAGAGWLFGPEDRLAWAHPEKADGLFEQLCQRADVCALRGAYAHRRRECGLGKALDVAKRASSSRAVCCLFSLFFRHPQTLTCLCARKESVNDSVIRALQEMGIEHTIRQPSLLSRLYGRTVILLPQLSATLILWNSHGRASLSIRPRCPKTLYCAVS